MNAHLQRGWRLIELSRYRESQAEFELAKASAEDLASASLGLGWSSLHLGDSMKAMEHAKEALSINPNSVTARTILGKALLELRKLAEAEQHFREALRLKPSRSDLHADLALFLLADDKPVEAENQVHEGLACDPRNLACRIILVRSLIEQKRPKEARSAADQCLALHPDSADAHKMGALAAIAAEDFPAAKQHGLEALRLEPTNAEARDIYIQSLRETYPVYSRLVRLGMRAGDALENPKLGTALIVFPACMMLCSLSFIAFALVTDALSTVMFGLRRETRVLLTSDESKSVPWLIGALVLAVTAFLAGYLTNGSGFFRLGLAAIFLLQPIKLLFARLEDGVGGWFFYIVILLGTTVATVFALQFFIQKPSLDTYSMGTCLGALALCLSTFAPILSDWPKDSQTDRAQDP